MCCLLNRTIGISFMSADACTDRRNWVPIFPLIAGDRIGEIQVVSHEDHHLTPTCRFGTSTYQHALDTLAEQKGLAA